MQYCHEVLGIALSRDQLSAEAPGKMFPIRLEHDQIDAWIPQIVKTARRDPALIDLEFPRDIYRHALSGRVSRTELQYILMAVASEQHMIMIGEANADRFGFDLAHGRHNFFLSQLAARRLVTEWTKRVPLQESEVASYAFETEFTCLSELSLADAVRFREADVLQETRKGLRASRAALKKATLEGFQQAAAVFERDIRQYVADEEKDAERAIAEARRKLKLSALSFSGGAVLAVASFAFPSIAPAALIATIVSLTLGSSSLRDVVNAHLTGRRKRSELRDRPIAILADAMAKGPVRSARTSRRSN